MAGLLSNGLTVGKNVSIQEPFFLDPAHCFLISIGDRTTFAPNVYLIAHDASTKRALGYSKIGQIKIGKGCFIGACTTVLCDVTIGDRCIIGAGSVVTKSIPDDSVAVGNPAKVIASSAEYLAQNRESASQIGVFSADYQLPKASRHQRNEMLAATKNGTAFLK